MDEFENALFKVWTMKTEAFENYIFCHVINSAIMVEDIVQQLFWILSIWTVLLKINVGLYMIQLAVLWHEMFTQMLFRQLSLSVFLFATL